MKGLMESREAQALMKNEGAVNALRESRDGQKLMELAGKQDLAAAVEKGDTQRVQAAVAQMLSTESGKRLAEELKRLIGR